MNHIEEALNKLFQKYRIIFWYDAKQEFSEMFSDLDLPGIQKHQVDNNEFYLKHQAIKEHPEDRFLFYLPYPEPQYEDNWLLDLQLSGYVFQTDQVALYLQELELDMRFRSVISDHLEFFRNKERRLKLKEMLESGDDEHGIRYKLTAITLGVDNPGLVYFIQQQGVEFIAENKQPEKDLERFNLKDFFWKEIAQRYNFHSDAPSFYGFMLELFANNFSLCKKSGISKDSKILLSVWKDKISCQESFRALSQRLAKDLKIEKLLQTASIDEIIDDDLFDLVDKKIISELSHQIVSESASSDKVSRIIKRRENKYWYDDYKPFYQSLEDASTMISHVRKITPVLFASFEEGVEQYSRELFRVDLHYRRFLYHYRQTGQNKVLDPLATKIGKVYTNDWLLSSGNEWQKIIDKTDRWNASSNYFQQKFFQVHVRPFTVKNQRLFVIISDALRFESGWEYCRKIQTENRYEAEMGYMYTGLPSYTQLGMAALLPGQEMSIAEEGQVTVNGLSSAGIAGRTKILEQFSGTRATAINAEDFMKMNSATEGRDFVKQYDLIYIFHNQIDKVGDDKNTETEVVNAVTQEFDYLTDLLKKISNMNGYNMIITSDHGFLYQHEPLEESDFSTAEYSGEIWKESRRFVIGSSLKDVKKAVVFSSQQLNLKGEAEILVPRSINRIRIKGSGSRYTHGGASLQEIVVPVIKVAKRRSDTVRQVEVDVIKSSDRITTNIVNVSFIQSQLVSAGMLPRTIRASIVGGGNDLLSDQFTYEFDITEGSERMREVKHYFQMSSRAREKYNNQRVTLLLEEPIPDSSAWKTYKEFTYTLSITFTSDFDN